MSSRDHFRNRPTRPRRIGGMQDDDLISGAWHLATETEVELFAHFHEFEQLPEAVIDEAMVMGGLANEVMQQSLPVVELS